MASACEAKLDGAPCPCVEPEYTCVEPENICRPARDGGGDLPDGSQGDADGGLDADAGGGGSPDAQVPAVDASLL